MEDAHRRALNGVADTMRSKERFLHSHAGYYGMPKAVLGQRKFANPSNGNQADIYNNRNVSFDMPPTVWSTYRPEGLSGGVLYTAEAQKWGRQKLRERIPQLDAIKAEREAFVNGLPVQGTVGQMEGTEGVEGSKVKLEIVATLRAILSSLQAGKADAFAWNDTLKFMRLFFRFASTASEEELKEVLEYFDSIEESLIGLQEVGEDGRNADELFNDKIAPNVDIMLEDFQKLREYITKMLEGVDRSTKERKSLSANLIKSIGFTTLKKASNVEQLARMVRDVERGDRIRDEKAPPVLPEGGEEFSDRWLGRSGRPLSAVAEAMRRYYESVGFDPNPRENIGRKNGSFFGDSDASSVGSEAWQLRNPFREGNGEDQAQGLEVSEEEPSGSEDEEESMGARSRSSRGSRGAESAVSDERSAELSDAELRSRLGAPASASASASVAPVAPAPVAPQPAPVALRNIAEIQRQRQQLYATMTPEMVRQRGRVILPPDERRLYALCQRWENEGLGKGGDRNRGYVPRSVESNRKSMIKGMIPSYKI